MQDYFVEELREEDYPNYNDYLKNNPQSHYGHSLKIKELITKYFKFKPRYLVAKKTDNHAIVGILPLFEAHSLIYINNKLPFSILLPIVHADRIAAIKKNKAKKKKSKEGRRSCSISLG